jgi:L-threonylcarbamoyladenylate synthase
MLTSLKIDKDIGSAQAFLEQGELVAIPTETVYGLAANALDESAVIKIFEAKQRPTFDPLIVHTSSLARAAEFADTSNPKIQPLVDRFWPGPLTLLLPRKPIVPDLVTAGLETVAVRVPKHPMMRQLLAQLDFPLAAPSANPFGFISPTRAQHVADQLGDKVAYILDGGPAEVGIESTIIGFPEGVPTIYRLGGLSLEEIEEVVGEVAVKPHSSSNPTSPGQLKQHYAPATPLQLGAIEELLPQYEPTAVGLLSFSQHYPQVPAQQQFVLSEAGDPTEAARNLFAAMRHLDALQVSVILAELLPEEGLGRAVNDRLRRAAAKRPSEPHHLRSG